MVFNRFYAAFAVLLLSSISINYADGTLAAMSIDLGTQFIKVGLVKSGVPMEIVLNKESRRKTPNLVGIRNNERYFGDAAQAVITRYPTAVYGNLLDLLGKNVDHDSVKLFTKRFPQLKIEKHANNSGIAVPFGDQQYSIESLFAMVLSSVRDFTEAYAEQTVKDVVITVPAYFTQTERLAIEKAAQIAKLNLLQLVNDGTASALSYGVFRRKEITDKPQRLLVYDMGAAKTTATLVEYRLVKEKYGNEPKMTVLGVGFDRSLGGLELTLRLQNLLIEKFRKNYNTNKDITTNDKAIAKLFKEAERVKQVLSANADHFAQIESVHEDKDMKIKVTRDELDFLMIDLEPRMTAPIAQSLLQADLKVDQIDQFVLMGAGTRVPRVQAVLQTFLEGKDLGRFLNTDEASAMGALFLSAHLSKGFKVKPFNVQDLVIFPIQVNFVSKQKQDDGSIVENPITRRVFQYKTGFPSNSKTISFSSFVEDFSFDVNYDSLGHFTADQTNEFGNLVYSLVHVDVNGLGALLEEKHRPEATEFKGVKVGLKLDASGIVRITKAEATIEKKHKSVVESITNTLSGFFSTAEEEGAATDAVDKKEEEPLEGETVEPEPAEEPEKKDEDGTKLGKEEETAHPETKSDNATENTSAQQGNATTKEEKVPEVIVVKLKITEGYSVANVLSANDVDEAKSVLEGFDRSEKLAHERHVAENELESAAFDASLKLDEVDFIQFMSEEEQEKLREEVKRIRSWLEDGTTPETKTGEFKENFKKIEDIVRVVKRRQKEDKARPEAVTNLESMINSSMVFVKMGGDDEKSLFHKNDTEALEKKLIKLSAWLQERKEKQAEMKIFENPAFTTNEVQGKIKALDKELKGFMKKMKAERTVNLNTDKNAKKTNKKKEKEASEKTDDNEKKEDNKTEGKDSDKKTEL